MWKGGGGVIAGKIIAYIGFTGGATAPPDPPGLGPPAPKK